MNYLYYYFDLLFSLFQTSIQMVTVDPLYSLQFQKEVSNIKKIRNINSNDNQIKERIMNYLFDLLSFLYPFLLLTNSI
jgi:hypothetical protein